MIASCDLALQPSDFCCKDSSHQWDADQSQPHTTSAPAWQTPASLIEAMRCEAASSATTLLPLFSHVDNARDFKSRALFAKFYLDLRRQ